MNLLRMKLLPLTLNNMAKTWFNSLKTKKYYNID